MNNKTTPTISTKLSSQERLNLDELVEQRGSSRSEALRFCFNEYLEQESLVQQLNDRERRLFKGIFAMLALALQLTAEERKQMTKQLRSIGISW